MVKGDLPEKPMHVVTAKDMEDIIHYWRMHGFLAGIATSCAVFVVAMTILGVWVTNR